MTDLINKVDKSIVDNRQAVQNLVEKYSGVLQHTKPESEFPYHAYVLDYCVKTIKQNHSNENSDWKTWASLVVFKLFKDGKIIKESQIPTIISEFFDYKEKEYNKFCEDIVAVNEYERDRGFVYRFYFRKKR